MPNKADLHCLRRVGNQHLGMAQRTGYSHDDALVALFDDDSPQVRGAVIGELKRMGPSGLALLEQVSGGENRVLAALAGELRREVAGPNTIELFENFIESLHYELESGCILLERTVNPDLTAEAVTGKLDALAEACRPHLKPDSRPWEHCTVLNEVLLGESGLRGDNTDFDNPLNSFLGSVIERKRGIPISLAIIYILVAQRLGVELEPVGMPGRFMVGCFTDESVFYVDPFEGGSFRTSEELAEFLRGNNLKPAASYLAPSPTGEVLCRCCRNLVRQYSLAGERERADTFASFVRRFEEVYRREARS